MGYTQQFPNGQVLTSSELDIQQITDIFQQATCSCFGLSNNLPFSTTLTEESNEIVLEDLTGVAVGNLVSDTPGFGVVLYGSGGYGDGGNIPANTVIVSIDQSTNTLTLSNKATASGATTVFVSDLKCGRLVRQSWPTNGMPAFGQQDNVSFVRCVEIDDWYNKVRDQSTDPIEDDDENATITQEYTRVWEVFWELRGPTSAQRAALLKSAMQLDFIRDSLAAFNLYLMPAIAAPVRAPELDDAGWWERVDLRMTFYEQVNEVTTMPTVTSVEIQVWNDQGLQIDIEVE
jgi:hypothetical protein